jgi:O-methyltransferase domain/Dimerisation domain
MADDDQRPAVELRRLVNGYQISQAIYVAARLGVADLLADGPRSSDELAAETSADPPSLYRLLRALAAVGVVREEDDRRFALTELGDALRSDAPDGIAGWAAFAGRPSHWQAWGDLLHSVRTGENAFRHVHGTDVWSYRAARPEESAVFDRAMMALTRSSNQALVEAYDFGRFGTIVDVGGGNGTLLALLLARYPALEGVLFDQPHVVAGADEVLRAAAVADRCRVVGGSFFDGIPAGGDAYALKAIIHDWLDEEAIKILGRCRAVVRQDGTLLVIERVLGPPNADPVAKLSDLNMLVAAGGRERTIEEFESLFAAAGFGLVGVTPTAAGLSVIEAAPAY